MPYNRFSFDIYCIHSINSVYRQVLTSQFPQLSFPPWYPYLCSLLFFGNKNHWIFVRWTLADCFLPTLSFIARVQWMDLKSSSWCPAWEQEAGPMARLIFFVGCLSRLAILCCLNSCALETSISCFLSFIPLEVGQRGRVRFRKEG